MSEENRVSLKSENKCMLSRFQAKTHRNDGARAVAMANDVEFRWMLVDQVHAGFENDIGSVAAVHALKHANFEA